MTRKARKIGIMLAVGIGLALFGGWIGARGAPTFVSPVPWCEEVGGVQPCLPWRPTPGAPAEGVVLGWRVYLPVIAFEK